ncbi:signal peptide, CUB and EGF-like domain-containing protein 2, partial [Pecten maximus]|uniref:signal peptide, CUB and EGF-like domain-containing protein 2 n=1 Tax=Pecten maximus TaxID=6579 RepID=UPI001457E741
VDACTDGTNGGCAHICVSTGSGAYVCLCNSGYGLDADGHNCSDIDECTDYGPCEQICTNTVGSFQCSCRSGFTVDSTTTSTCNDVDECTNSSLCTGGQTCVNSYGSYHCVASAAGMVPEIPGEEAAERASLTIVDACSDGTNGGCEHVCATTRNGAYACLCHVGYRLASNGHNCTDVDECTELRLCDQTCINSPGTYTCGCREGYLLDTDNVTCNAIDACSDGTNGGCEHVCVTNKNGAYDCLCHVGYRLASNGHNCTDVDECTELRLCDQTCINSPGTYTCGCREGYILDTDNVTCNDMNECNDSSACPEPEVGVSICINTYGSYYCLIFNEKSSVVHEEQLLSDQSEHQPPFYDDEHYPLEQEDYDVNGDRILGKKSRSVGEYTTRRYQFSTPDVGEYPQPHNNGDLKIVIGFLAGALCITLIVIIGIV